jgi:hypothetical protein
VFTESFVGGSAGGNFISAAIFARWRATSNSVTGRNAVLPFRNPSALTLQPSPSAVTIPAPVTTTLSGPTALLVFDEEKSTTL